MSRCFCLGQGRELSREGGHNNLLPSKGGFSAGSGGW